MRVLLDKEKKVLIGIIFRWLEEHFASFIIIIIIKNGDYIVQMGRISRAV